MAKVIRNKKRINEKTEMAINELERDMKSESRWAAIQALIPLGLMAVEAELQRDRARPQWLRHRGNIYRWKMVCRK